MKKILAIAVVLLVVVGAVDFYHKMPQTEYTVVLYHIDGMRDTVSHVSRVEPRQPVWYKNGGWSSGFGHDVCRIKILRRREVKEYEKDK